MSHPIGGNVYNQSPFFHRFRSFFLHGLVGVAAGAVAPLQIALAETQQPPTDIAISLLEFGGSTARLLWVSTKDSIVVKSGPGDVYSRLADDLQHRIELGHATAAVAAGPFNVASAGLTYAAVADPEPTTKLVAGIAAWGAKKGGTYLAEKVESEVRKQALGILSRALKDSKVSVQELRNLSPDELAARVGDLQIGNQKLSVALQDVPGAQQMLEFQMRDLGINATLVSLETAKENSGSLKQIKGQLNQTQSDLKNYAAALNKKLDTVKSDLQGVQETTNAILTETSAVRSAVQGNTQALNDLSQISYMGWSTDQKLAAMRSGMFSHIEGDARDHLIKQLESEQKREVQIETIKNAASAFGDLATIGKNLGVDKNVVKGLQAAQIIAQGIASYTNPLAAVATLSSLAGLGGSDPNAAVMAALAEINRKLDQVIELQVKTLKAIDDLSRQVENFREEMLVHLDRIEHTVLVNNALLQSIVKLQWLPCDALISNPKTFNGQPDLSSLTILERVVSAPESKDRLQKCVTIYQDTFDANIARGSWGGLPVDRIAFPATKITDDTAQQQALNDLASRDAHRYNASRAYIVAKLSKEPAAIPRHLLRLALPANSAQAESLLDARFADDSLRARLDNFKCSDSELLTDGVRTILCSGQQGDSPVEGQWKSVINPVLLGPQCYPLIDNGIVIAALADLATESAGAYVLVAPNDLHNAGLKGPNDLMKRSLAEHKGQDLLDRLGWLADELVLEESVMAGDYVAELMEGDLYDPAVHSLRTTGDPGSLPALALNAMRENPVLARNVVLLGMRHAIRDRLGSATEAESKLYQQTLYQLGQVNIATPEGCANVSYAHARFDELLPNWVIAYRKAKVETDERFNRCAVVEDEGVTSSYVLLGSLAIQSPSPIQLSNGNFEQPEILRWALTYRDRVHQAKIDRLLNTFVASVAKADSNVSPGQMAAELLNSVSPLQAGFNNVR